MPQRKLSIQEVSENARLGGRWIVEIVTQTDEAVKRFVMLFLNGMRTCVFKEGVPEFEIGGEVTGPFQAGEERELPNWVIEVLLNHGAVDIQPQDAFEATRRLQNLANAERNHPHNMQPFPPFLYAAVKRKIHRLERDKTSLDPRKYEEIEKLRLQVPTMIETRLSKIVKLAKSGDIQEKRGQMTLEERWLCERISSLIETWRQEVMP